MKVDGYWFRKIINGIREVLNTKIKSGTDISNKSGDIAIFLSSTFDDMGGERRAVKQAVDSLRRYAQDKGINLRLVDLRLGIENTEEEEDVYSEKVIRLCLESVENCRPYFIGLLGKRYGWIPNKEAIVLNKALFSDAHYELILQALNEEKSVTEMEMMLGILNAEEKNAFVYCLEDSVPEISYEVYRAEQLSHNNERKMPFEEEDIYNKYHNSFQESSLKKEKLRSLKKRLIQAEDVKTDTYKTNNQLTQLVKKDLENFIERNFTDKLNEFEREALRFSGFLKKMTGTYIPRKEIEKGIKFYLGHNNPKPLLITGKSGIGKSTVIAKMQSEMINQSKNVYAYYVGSTSIANTPVDIMLDIMKSLKTDESDIFSEEEIPTQAEDISLAFVEWLYKIKEKIVIIIDGIDQLQDQDHYDWLPYLIPTDVKLILTSSSDDVAVIEAIRSRYEGGLNSIEIKGITEAEQKEFIKQEYSVKHGKHEVSPIIIEALVSSAVLNSNPLYLETMINEIVHYGAYDGLEKFIQSYQKDGNEDGVYDLSDVYVSALKRRMEEFKSQPIQEIYALLSVTVMGLSEDEIQDILDKVYGIKISNLNLRLVMGSIDEYLISYSGLFKWRHTYLNQAIETILNKDEFDRARHAIIQKMELDMDQEKNNRKFSELLQQLISIGHINSIIEVLKQVPVFQNYNTHTYYQKSMVLLSNLKQSDQVLIPLFEFYEETKEIQGIYELGRLLENYGHLVNVLKLREIEYAFYLNKDGAKSHEAIRTLSNLGSIHYSLGNYQDALGYHQTCYSLSKSMLGEYNPLTLMELNNLGVIHQSLGNYKDALGYYEACYSLSKSVFGERNPTTLTTSKNLGAIHQSLGNYEDALGYYKACYRLRKAVLGEYNLATLSSLGSMSSIYHSIGNYQEALRYCNSYYKLSKEMLGEGHSSTLRGLENLGLICKSLGKYEESLEHYGICYKLSKEFLGESHPNTLTNLNNLGYIHDSLANYEEALVCYEVCYKLRKEVIGETHKNTLNTLNNIAYTHNENGDYEKAKELHRECLEKRASVFGESSLEVSSSYHNLARVYLNTQEYSKAITYVSKAIEIREQNNNQALVDKSQDLLNQIKTLEAKQ